MKRIISVIFALLLFTWVSHSQILERSIKATETLETGGVFNYQNTTIPVLDITYHEWSADSVTWRKAYVAGDSYMRFSNDTKTTWAGINVSGSGSGTSQIDTIIWTVAGVSDTITSGTASIYITSPDTIDGSSTNSQNAVSHEHELYIELNDNEDVNASPANGQVIKWNSSSSTWEAADDLIAGGASGYLKVGEVDGSLLVTNVNEILVDNGRVTDNGSGSVTIDFELDPIDGKQDFFRTDSLRVAEGDTFITFTTPLPDTDYIVSNVYADYSNGLQQQLSYDSIAVDGFRVLNILEDSATVNYLVMRNLDSLGLAVSDQGKILASSTDPTMGYLDSKTDDSTIGVVGNELTVLEIEATNLESTNTAVDNYYPSYDAATGGFTWEAGTSSSIGGSGTSGYMPYFTGSTTLSNSPFYTDASNVSIGTIDLTYDFQVYSATNQVTSFRSGSNNTVGLRRGAATNTNSVTFITGSTSNWDIGLSDSDIYGNGSEFFIGTDPAVASKYYFVIDTLGDVDITSGSLNISDTLFVAGGIKDSDGDLGTSGQFLGSTGTATDWISGGASGVASVNALTGTVLLYPELTGNLLNIVGNATTIDISGSTAVTANSAFTATPSSVITAGTNLSWSSNTLNFTETLAPIDATYLTQTANSTLTNEQALGSLSSGFMKVTTTSGVVSSVANIDLTSDVTGVLPNANIATALTGKTYNGVTIDGTGAATDFLNGAGGYTEPPGTLSGTQTITYSATPTMDYSTSKDGIITLTGAVTTFTFTNVPNQAEGNIAVIQDGTGGYGIASIVHSGLTVKPYKETFPTVASGYLNTDADGHSVISYKRIGNYLYVNYGSY